MPLLLFIPKVPEPVTLKWQIAVHGDHAHIILMPHITRSQVDELVNDVRRGYDSK